MPDPLRGLFRSSLKSLIARDHLTPVRLLDRGQESRLGFSADHGSFTLKVELSDEELAEGMIVTILTPEETS